MQALRPEGAREENFVTTASLGESLAFPTTRPGSFGYELAGLTTAAISGRSGYRFMSPSLLTTLKSPSFETGLMR